MQSTLRSPVAQPLRGCNSAARQKPRRCGVVQAATDTDLPGAASSSKRKLGAAANRAFLSARKAGTQDVREAQRPLAEYMALPASQYSVLDARKIERINDDMFKCYVGELKILNFSVEPVLTVSVTVEPEEQGCTIRLLSCQLRGSKFMEDINNKFSAQMINVVRWREAASSSGTSVPSGITASQKQIVSTTTLNVELEIPAWCSFVPAKTIESVGSGVLQNVLDAMVPRFLAQLQRDYQLWGKGDAARVTDGQL